MRRLFAFLILEACLCCAQVGPNVNTINISGEAEVKVVPDRVSILVGVESRSKALAAATEQTDTAVRHVIAAARELNVDPTDIQTDYIHVDLAYNDKASTTVEFYTATKAIQIVLKDTSKFQDLLHASLEAGANHIYGVEFSTSELRKYRDQARAMAVKAATEKAQDLAAAAGLKVVAKPLTIAGYSYGGGSFYGRCCGAFYGSQMYQNAVQNVASAGDGGIGSEGSVALGKISVTASVTMTFQIQ
jgi:uncharacterized protein